MRMIKLIKNTYYRKIFLFFLFLALFKNSTYAQTYHDCTTSEDLNEFLNNKKNTEDIIQAMELELSKSLSKFDKCIDQEYSQSKPNKNSIENSEKGKSVAKNLAEKEGTTETGELAEKEGSTETRELTEKEGTTETEELAEKKRQDENTINKYFSNKPIVESKASSDLSGTEANNETDEASFRSENTINSNAEYNEEISEAKVINSIQSVANPNLSGTEPIYNEVDEISIFEEDKDKNGIDYVEDTKEEVLNKEKTNQQLPKDIPIDDNDSVLEKQIKLAAMNEKDPEKKKRLWNEYRKYKGLPQKD